MKKYKNSVMNPREYRKKKEENKKKLLLRRKGKI
jgi:hypothetical protein